MKKLFCTLMAMIVIAPGVTSAAEGSKWKGEAELGAVITKGNTETENINGKAKAINDRDKWRHTALLEVLKSTDKDLTTAEKYLISGKSNYKLTERSYIFGILAYEEEKFSGFDNRTSENIGYGRSVLKNDTLSLDLELGAGARQSKVELTGDTQDETMVRGAAIFGWKISNSAKFGEELTIEAGDDSTITKSITFLKSQINGNLSSKITVTAKNTSDVPVGNKETDIETAVTLVYNFE